MEAALVMFKADGSRRDFPLERQRVIVGRKNTCDLRIPLTSVSRQHCELTLSDDRLVVRDLGSSNGTYHNSKRVQEATLEPGDELVIGPVVFTVVIDGKPQNIKPIRTLINDQEDTGELDAPPAAERSDTFEQVDEDQQAQPAAAATEDNDEELSPIDLDEPIYDGLGGGSGEQGSGIFDQDQPTPAGGEEDSGIIDLDEPGPVASNGADDESGIIDLDALDESSAGKSTGVSGADDDGIIDLDAEEADPLAALEALAGDEDDEDPQEESKAGSSVGDFGFLTEDDDKQQ